MSNNKEKKAFPKEDLKRWAEDVGSAAVGVVNEVVDHIKTANEEYGKKKTDTKYQKDLEVLHPVFQADLFPAMNSTSSLSRAALRSFPKIIHIVEKDKKHAESVACEGAIGHISKENGLDVLNIYPENINNSLGIRFFPDTKRSIYYIDPFKNLCYIDIDEYFTQQKTALVQELEQIAYALGANHVEICFENKTKEAESQEKKAGLKVKKGKSKAGIKAEHSGNESKSEALKVRSGTKLKGHNNPKKPELVYFKNNLDIQNLIFMRMDPENDLEEKTYYINYSKSMGIKTKDAAKIEGAIAKMGGGSADISLKEEAKKESQYTLIYKISFPPKENT